MHEITKVANIKQRGHWESAGLHFLTLFLRQAIVKCFQFTADVDILKIRLRP